MEGTLSAFETLRELRSERLSREEKLISIVDSLITTLEFYADGDWKIQESYRKGEYQGLKFNEAGPVADSGKKAREALANAIASLRKIP